VFRGNLKARTKKKEDRNKLDNARLQLDTQKNRRGRREEKGRGPRKAGGSRKGSLGWVVKVCFYKCLQNGWEKGGKGEKKKERAAAVLSSFFAGERKGGREGDEERKTGRLTLVRARVGEGGKKGKKGRTGAKAQQKAQASVAL